MDMVIVVTALIGIFITVILYISKIFNDKSQSIENNEIKEEPIPAERKKSESVSTCGLKEGSGVCLCTIQSCKMEKNV